MGIGGQLKLADLSDDRQKERGYEGRGKDKGRWMGQRTY